MNSVLATVLTGTSWKFLGLSKSNKLPFFSNAVTWRFPIIDYSLDWMIFLLFLFLRIRKRNENNFVGILFFQSIGLKENIDCISRVIIVKVNGYCVACLLMGLVI